jgi:hypothetical protein
VGGLDRVQSCNFFRGTLLRLTTGEQINSFLKRFDKEQKELRSQIVNLMWYMRGALSREEAWTLSITERRDIMEMVEERMKVVKESRMPLI